FCASGGMYIACSAEKIFATDSSLVGHVGVLLPTMFNFSQLMDTIGVGSKTITAGKDKDIMNPFRPWKPNEGASLQAITDVLYTQFVDIVTKSRPKLTKEALIEEGAQIYSVEEALRLGYIDDKTNSIDNTFFRFATVLC